MARKSQKHSGLNFFGIWWLYASYYFVFGTLSPNIDSIIASMPGATRPGISLLSALQLTINIISLLFFGILSDKLTKKISRKSLLLIANVLILAGTICTALSPNFITFFFFIQLVSLGSGSFLAVGFSIISDSFEQKDRGKFFGLMQFSLLFGAGGGMLLGAVIGGLGLNGWRYAYATGAILILASLTLYQILGFDPRRGSSDPELINLGDQIDYGYKMSLDSIKNVLKSKTILLSFITVVAINITHTTLGFWAIPFLNSKINPGSSSLVSTLIFVMSQLGGLVGSILGGKLGDSLYKKKKSRGRILLSTMALIFSSLSYIVFFLLIPFDNSTMITMILSITLMMIFGFIGSIFIAMRVGNVYAIYTECALPEDRGIANSLSGLMVQIGGIIGNIIVFFLVEDSLWLAIFVILVIGLLSSIPQALMYFTCSREATVCRETMVKRSTGLAREPE